MRRTNSFRITALMTLLTVVLLILGFLTGGPRGAFFALAVSLAANFFTYFRSGKFTLKRLGVRKVTDSNAKIRKVVKKVSRSAAAPEPDVYLISSKAPNALAIGRSPDSASLAVTEGLLETLSAEELEGVIGHEIAHIMQCDTLLNTFVASFAGAIGWLAGSLRFSLLSQTARRSVRGGGALFPIIIASTLAPVAAAIIQFSVSRSREFEADRKGAGYTNSYHALAVALRKIQRSADRIDQDQFPEIAHMFFISGFSSRWLAALFSTHPPIEERIERLERMALTGGGVATN